MKFQSTRDSSNQKFNASFVIKQGLATDGGLFVPDEIPQFSQDMIRELCDLSYPERAARVLKAFLNDYTYEELLEDCTSAYAETSFVGGAAPVVALKNNVYSLELWHGPTSAFKDMALQIMPRLLSRALKKTGEVRTALILVATSGDTGKAALEGYKNIDGIKIMVFYPVDGVSRVQKLQMATQTGSNVNVVSIVGNFDDAQTGVKAIFSNAEIQKEMNRRGYFFSSANSINWGRLAPQIAYYVSAYCDLVRAGKILLGNPMDVCVPTGNFGNILAAYFAKRAGLPIRKLICASNSNNVLTDFLETGTYNRNRPFHLTMSPSMDILISSNLERLLWLVCGTEKTRQYMKDLSENGSYTVDAATMKTIREDFCGYYADETQTADTIRSYFADGYLADTHTAVGLYAAGRYQKINGSDVPLIVDSTASPYKFASDVYAALFGKKPSDPLQALGMLAEQTNTSIPYPLAGLASRKVRFETVIRPDEMAAEILKFAD